PSASSALSPLSLHDALPISVPRRARRAPAVRRAGARSRSRGPVPRGLGLRTHAAGGRQPVASGRGRLRPLVGRTAREARSGRPGAPLHAGGARRAPRPLVPAPGDAAAAFRHPRPASSGIADALRHALERARRAALEALHALGAAPVLAGAPRAPP